MKRNLVVTVDCGEKTCGGCPWKAMDSDYTRSKPREMCGLFCAWRTLRPGGTLSRCRACLAAERKVK